ncbi:MAG: cation diffusion facilitator family transporter [Bacteroidales bacterium]|nr:cation diffusion facilitator family transporter [Bacteroidales bacterium]MDZ4204378.1 cation diffusion facilitator family transporter [Bacteroidales bacterium]
MKNTDKEHKIYLAKKEGWVSLILNILLFILKLWAGIVSASLALIADAWHTLSDSLTSIVLLLGMKLSSKPADNDHPFGHGRAETLASLIIGILLAVVGFSFLSDSISKLRNHEPAAYGTFAIVATILSVLLKEGLAQYAFMIHRRTGISAVKADAWHHRSDAISSVIILVGILLGSQYWWMDGVLGMAVSFALFYVAYDIIRDTATAFFGETPDDELLEQLHQISLKTINRDVSLHHVHIHRYGDHTELTCHIKLPPEISLSQAHHIATVFEKDILEETGIIATIHMEPIETSP